MERECVIERAWRVFLGLMIFSVAAFAILLLYSAFFAALTRQWPVASTYAAMATALSCGVGWLCYHSRDLVSLH